MADKILHKRSYTSNSKPTISNLDKGELAINVNDGKAFLRKANGVTDTVEEFIVSNTANTGSIILSGSIITNELTINSDTFLFTGSIDISGSVLITGSLSVSGSINGTSSWAQNSSTSSYILSSNVAGPHGLNSILSSSYAITSSYALNAGVVIPDTSSWAYNSLTASTADNFTVRGTLTAKTIVVETITSSVSYLTGSTRFGSLITDIHQFTGSVNITGSLNAPIITGSLFGTSSWASSSISASYSLSASNAQTASFILTASWANNVTTASRALQANTASYIQLAASSSYALSASNAITASYILSAASASYSLSSSNAQTASFIATASWANNATNAITASWATSVNTASWANNVTTSSRALQANTASYIQNAASASYALSASVAFSSSYAMSSSYSISSSYALSASFSTNAANAFIQGGNSFTTGAILGTNDDQPLFFETSGSTRMKINNSGIPFNIQYVDFASTVTTAITLPSNLLPNDVVIVACHNTNATPAIPTGYTIGQSGSANTVNYLWAYKTMGSPVDTTVSGLVVGSNMAFVFRNVNTSSIIHATGTPSTGATLMPDPPSVTTTISGSMIVAIGYLDDDTISPTLISASLGFNLIGSITSGSGANGGVTMAEYLQQTTPGTIDPGTFNSGSATANDAWVGITFALTPITASGFIGINTNNPQTQLHVYSSTPDGTILGRTTPLNILTLESENTADLEYSGFGQALAFRGVTYNNTSSRVLGRIIHKINDDSVSTTRGTSIHFETLPNATSILPTEKMVINYLGYVGIGTSDPTTLLHVAGTVSASAFTGSIFGTSSWATNINTASWANNATNAVSSSWATNINTASWASNATNASTASWATSVNTASWANNATNAITSSWATSVNTASWANNVTTASRALQANTASYIQTAANATSASYALSASYAMSASQAFNAVTASYALNAASAFIQGGNSFGAAAILGTNEIQNLQFETNGSTRMTISGSNGYVGINTTTPQNILDVYAPGGAGIAASFGGAFSPTSFSGIHFGYLETTNTSYRKSALVFERTDNHGQGGNASGKIHFLLNNNGATSATSLTDAIVTIDSEISGAIGSVRMGVGTKTPSSSLHIANTNPRGVIIGNTTGSVGTLQLTNNVFSSPIASRIMFGTDGTGWQMRIAKNTAGTIADLITVQDNGNVGIGNVTPPSALTVNGTVSGSIFASANASMYVNGTSTYGQWVISGSKGSYGGIYDAYSTVNGFMYDSAGNGGIFKEGTAWYLYYKVSDACLAVNGSTTSATYALYVNGKGIYSAGDVVAYSDARKKTDIVTIDNALEKVKNLRGVYYTKIGEEDKGRKTGVIAQEVEKILPEVVNYNIENDEYGVAYGNTVGILIEAIKEQQKQIEDLQKQINYLTENR